MCVNGELTDEDKILESLENVDAVISVLGPVMGHPYNTHIANGYKVIIKCMKEKNIDRLIALSTSSCSDEKYRFSLLQKMHIKESGKVIKSSNLKWTLFSWDFKK